MIAALVTLGVFAALAVIGAAVLALLRADLRDLRVVLTAPALGSASTLVPLFVLSNAGIAIGTAAPPLVAALLIASVVVLAVRWPRLPLAAAPVVALAVLDLVLVGRPLFDFGFNWIANANSDMALYVLAATQLTEHGLQSPVDWAALDDNRDFPTSAQRIHLAGLRPGAQIGLAALSVLADRPAVTVYAPLLLALNMCGACAVGALAMQAARRSWVATLAAALFVLSPLAGYAVIQQLMPQVWGLALAVALFAWLLRPDVHHDRGPRFHELIVISVLTAALFVVYMEAAASLSLAYALYVGLLAARRRVTIRSVALLWAAPLAATLLVLNTFLPRAFGYLRSAISGGLEGFGEPIFGYAAVPTALPGVLGIQQLFAAPSAPHMDAYIVVAAVLGAVVAFVCVGSALKGSAAATVVTADLALGVVLAVNENDFGLFKLYMYAQPFLAAAVAGVIGSVRRLPVLVVVAALVGTVGLAQIRTLNAYVELSVDPIDLPDASEPDLVPAFRQRVARESRPVVAVTENFTLATLFGADAGDKRVYFVGRNAFALPWASRRFELPGVRGRVLTFGQNTDAARVLERGRCVIVLPTGSQVPLNRIAYPEGSPNLAFPACEDTRDVLAFVVSSQGQPFTIPLIRRAVGFWQLQPDPWFPGRTLAGFGRYALLQLIRPSQRLRVRLELSTTSLAHGGDAQRLPPAAVSGIDRAPFALAGNGSARTFSPPVRPRVIGGQSYIVLDMGRAARLQPVRRPGLTGLWGTSIPLDPRRLTSYVRDVSLVTDEQYSRHDAPAVVREFPGDLTDPGLEYSGIYEDGWVGREAFALLAGGGPSTLTVRAEVLPIPGQRLEVFVDGRRLASQRVARGVVEVRVDVPFSQRRRRVELRWAKEMRLSPLDVRFGAARLLYLAVR